MQRVALVAALAALPSCATTAAIARPHRVSLPILIGTTVADLVVVGLVSSQIKDFNTAAVIATTTAATVADVGVSCVLGGCSSLGL